MQKTTWKKSAGYLSVKINKLVGMELSMAADIPSQTSTTQSIVMLDCLDTLKGRMVIQVQ